jgi:L-Ala-D/L-Glu epimerase
MALSCTARIETWALAERFVIARGAKTHADVLVAEITDGRHTGRGEAVPYARYDETPDQQHAIVLGTWQALAHATPTPADLRRELQTALKACAARNALDCALWDYEAKATGQSVASLINTTPPREVLTAYTLSLDTPDAMAAKAKSVPHLPLLKLKLGGVGDEARLRAIRAARPDARLIGDANEAWTIESLPHLLAVSAETRLELIEQPLPAHRDAALVGCPRTVAVCADESLHTRADLAQIAQRYDAINIKLDKTGGLTEALALDRDARALGLKIMVGCMVATSLAMAPALMIAATADYVDLDGPLLLATDRAPGLMIANGVIRPPARALWG